MGGLSVAIMAHPKRHRFVADLHSQLPAADIVWDRADDRWDTGRRALLAVQPDCDWHLVVQDDAILCDRFLPAVHSALGAIPAGFPVSFYTGRTRPYATYVAEAVRNATRQRKNWIAMRGPLWGVAIAVPSACVKELVEFGDALATVPNYDIRISEYFHREKRRACWYSLPSLVDHRVGPENPSLVPGRSSGLGRCAHTFAGADTPAQWSSDAYWPGDPSEPWFEDYTCSRCLEPHGSLVEVIRHCYDKHRLGPVDLLASTPHHADRLQQLHQQLPASVRGRVWLVGDAPQVQVPAERVKRHQAAQRLGSGNFVVTGALRDLKYVGNRSAWSLDGIPN